MNYINKIGLLTCLAVLGLSMESCNKSKDPEIQDVKLINAQLASFSLASSTDSTLTQYAFSISNGKTGIVTNATPIAYGTSLEKVRLVIHPASSTTTVELALGGDSWEQWDPKKEYNLSSIPANGLHIRLTSSSTATAQPFSYTYKVELKAHSSDPHTINWSEVSTSTGLSSLGSNACIVRLGDSFHLVSLVGFAYQHLVSSTTSPLVWSPASINGLPSGESIFQLVGAGNRLYLLTQSGKLYSYDTSASTNAWMFLPDISAKLLLGVLPESKLCLVTQQSQFGVYDGDKLSTLSNKVPTNFPSTPDFIAYTDRQAFVGSSLSLLSATHSAGKVARTSWYTTNGQDWLLRYNIKSDEATAPSHSYLTQLGNYYMSLENRGTTTNVYATQDLGKSWQEVTQPAQIPTTLTQQLSAGNPIAIYSTGEELIAIWESAGAVQGITGKLAY